MSRYTKPTIQSVCRIAVLVSLILAPLLQYRAYAGNINSREIVMSSSVVSATSVTYRVGFDVSVATSLGSVVLEFCDNNPFPEIACVNSVGFNASATNIINQSGVTDMYRHASSTANRIVLARPAAQMFGPANIGFELNNIQNPDTARPFYARITIYPTTDGSGLWSENGGVALMTNDNFGVSATVPPYLYFCTAVSFSGYDCNSASSSFSDFGEFSITSTKTATSQFIVGTNADYGLSVTVNGSSLTAGNNVIPAANLGPSVPGRPQFAINLRANTNPGVGSDPVGPGGAVVTSDYGVVNRFKYASGDSIVTSDDVVDYKKFTVSYIVNINKAQAPGVYNTTLTYICLANF